MIEQEQPIEPVLKQLMNEIGRLIGGALANTVASTGERYGFALFMFSLKGGEESSRMNYISNCDRNDMLAALKEFIARNEGTYTPDFLGRKQ